LYVLKEHIKILQRDKDLWKAQAWNTLLLKKKVDQENTKETASLYALACGSSKHPFLSKERKACTEKKDG